MTTMHPQTADAFCEEMEKMAGLGGAAATLGTVGGLLGAGKNYMQAKAEGQDTKGALLSAGKGAVVGGGIGAGAGLAAGGLSRALRGANPVEYAKYLAPAERAGHVAAGRMAADATNLPGTPWYKAMDKSISDFGARQLHAVTGYAGGAGKDAVKRRQYLEGIGVGGRDVAGSLEATREGVTKLREQLGEKPEGAWNRLKMWRANRGLASEEEAFKAHNTLMDTGATSLPGYARAMLGPDRGKVLGATAGQAWHGGGTMGKAMLGMGALSTGQAALGAPQPGEEGMGRGERVARGVGQMAGFALPMHIPIVGQMLGGELISRGAGRVGRLLDRPKVVPPAARMIHDPTDPVASTANQTGREVSMSPSAQGKPYGGGME